MYLKGRKMSSFEEINEASINDVTLFSNGIGHFRRIYHIKKSQNEKISIPFKRDHIGDVAASLQVFGKVKLKLAIYRVRLKHYVDKKILKQQFQTELN